MDLNYSVDKNVQILLSLLKQHNIKKVIASPGATNITVVGSMQNDPFFEIYSCVDERSAAYMACGLAVESGEPVILSCTGATSSRNYLPALTEAFYSKLPILAITSSLESSKIGHLWAQVTDRSTPPSDTVKKSYYLQPVKDEEDFWDCTIKVNDAILNLTHQTKGPVHINLAIHNSTLYNVKELPKVQKIERYYWGNKLPEITSEHIGIFVGAHSLWTENQIKQIDLFCEKYNAIVLCDQTSNYYGKYRCMFSIVAAQENETFCLLNFDLLIHIGEMSGDYFLLNKLRPKRVWRVNVDGQLRDRFKKLENVFEMPEECFFNYYNSNGKHVIKEHYISSKKQFDEIIIEIKEKLNTINFPLSNIYTASYLSKILPQNTLLYLGILNTLRSWNFFETKNNPFVLSNVGGFGIDGMISSLVGTSLYNKHKLYLGVTGDLAFFYDINVLGNRHISPKIRILLINNGHGQEFCNYNHAASIFGEDTNKFIAAEGHNGKKSPCLVKHLAEDLGFIYISASTKLTFVENIQTFISTDLQKPVIFEVFTNSDDENEALKMCCRLIPPKETKESSVSNPIRNLAKKVIGEKGVKIIKIIKE